MPSVSRLSASKWHSLRLEAQAPLLPVVYRTSLARSAALLLYVLHLTTLSFDVGDSSSAEVAAGLSLPRPSHRETVLALPK